MASHRQAARVGETEVGNSDVLTERTRHGATAEAGARDPFAVDVEGDPLQRLLGYDGVGAAPGGAVLQLRCLSDGGGSGVALLEAHPKRLELRCVERRGVDREVAGRDLGVCD